MAARAKASLLPGAFLLAACLAPDMAAAEPRTLRLGDMELAYDGERWRAEPDGDRAVTMRPAGAIERKLDPITLTWAPAEGIEGCRTLAARAFSDLYEQPEAGPIEIAGTPGIRLAAHTRCRNATPTGVVACVPYRGSVYLLTATQTSCRSPGFNLFSGIDPLRELLDGMRFLP